MKLGDYRASWERKPVLRAVYRDFYQRISAVCRSGRTLEIGGGVGNLTEALDDVISTDIQWAPWLDAVGDAQQLPFAEASFDNIVMVDVLHHIQCPSYFFAEACRVLQPGGRLVMMEPAMTPLARLFYTWLHEEPVDMEADPLAICEIDRGHDPYDANQAIPTLIFGRHVVRFKERFPELCVKETYYLSLFAYPLSGGFQAWSLIPTVAVRPLLTLETWLLPILGPLMAFRILIVLERKQGSVQQVRPNPCEPA